MIIGVDVDGVLTNLYRYVKKRNKVYFKHEKLAEKKKKNNGLGELLGWSKDQDDRFWADNIFDYSINVKFYKQASKYLQKLKDDGHQIYIITLRYYLGEDSERGKEMEKIFYKSFEDNNIVYDKIFALFPVGDKLPTILEKKVDVMIDDSRFNLESISKHVPTICYHTKYNKYLKLDNMTRCKNWKQIYKTIKQMEVK